MTSSYCVVQGCRGRRGHTFPRDTVRLQSWLKVLKWKQPGEPHKNAFVCRKHFLKSDYKHRNEEQTGEIITGVRTRWRLKKTAIPSVFESYDNDENPEEYISKRKVPLPALIEVGDEDKSSLPEANFTVGDVLFYLDTGITDSDVNESILKALGCSSPSENDELSAFSETVRSQLYGKNGETTGISLPTSEGMLEITPKSSLLNAIDYDSDDSEDGFITISRNYDGSDGSTIEDVDLTEITIPVKNHLMLSEDQVNEDRNSSEPQFAPNVSNIIVFDANEEGVETMKSLLLAQIEEERKPPPCPPCDEKSNVTINEYSSKFPKVKSQTEYRPNGLYNFKLSPVVPDTPSDSKNNNLLSAIRKTLPEVVVSKRKIMLIKKQYSGLNFVNDKEAIPPSVDSQPSINTPSISMPSETSTESLVQNNNSQCIPQQFCLKRVNADKTAEGHSYIVFTKKDPNVNACDFDEFGRSPPKSLPSTSEDPSPSKSSAITSIKPVKNSCERKTHKIDASSEFPSELISDQLISDDDESLDLRISLSSETGNPDDDSSQVDVEQLDDSSSSSAPDINDSKQGTVSDGLLTIDLDSDGETFEGTTESLVTTGNVEMYIDIGKATKKISSKQVETKDLDSNTKSSFEVTADSLIKTNNVEKPKDNEKATKQMASKQFETNGLDPNKESSFEGTTKSSLTMNNVEKTIDIEKATKQMASKHFETNILDIDRESSCETNGLDPSKESSFEGTTNSSLKMNNVEKSIDIEKVTKQMASKQFETNGLDPNKESSFEGTTKSSLTMNNVEKSIDIEKVTKQMAKKQFETHGLNIDRGPSYEGKAKSLITDSVEKSNDIRKSTKKVTSEQFETIDLDSEEETSFENTTKSSITMDDVEKVTDIGKAAKEITKKLVQTPSNISDVDLSKCAVKSADSVCVAASSSSKVSLEKTNQSGDLKVLDSSHDSETVSCSSSVLYTTGYFDDDYSVGNIEKSKFIDELPIALDELPNTIDEDTRDVEAVDPLGGSDSGLESKNNSNNYLGIMCDGSSVVILDDAEVQKMIENEKDDSREHSCDNSGRKTDHDSDSDACDLDMPEMVQESCLQFEVVENDSEMIMDDAHCETENSVKPQTPRNFESDVHQSIDSAVDPNSANTNSQIPSLTKSTFTVPQPPLPRHYTTNLRRGRPAKHRLLPPPLMLPDHDYTPLRYDLIMRGVKKKRISRKDFKLKPCSVVLERLDASVLSQFDKELDEDQLETPGSPSSSPTPVNMNCFQCGDVSPSVSMLCEHIISHHAKSKFQCPHCSEKFCSVLECNSHIGICKDIAESSSSCITYLCPQCDFSTKDDSDLRGHIDVEHRVKCNYSCVICPFKCVSEPALQNHIKRYHPPVTTGASSTVQSSISTQSKMVTITSPSGNIQQPTSITQNEVQWEHQCLVCQFKFTSEALLQSHMKCHQSESIEQSSTLPHSYPTITTGQIDQQESSSPSLQYYYKCVSCCFRCESFALLHQHYLRHHPYLERKLEEQLGEQSISTNQVQKSECVVQQPARPVQQNMNNMTFVTRHVVRPQAKQNALRVYPGCVPIRPKPTMLQKFVKVVEPQHTRIVATVQSAGGTSVPKVMARPSYSVGHSALKEQKSKVKFLFPCRRSNTSFVQVDPAVKSTSTTPSLPVMMEPQAEIDLTVDDGECDSDQLRGPSPAKTNIICPQCNEDKVSFADLGRHIIEKHYVRKHKCEHCSKLYITKDNLEKHIAQKHMVACPECSFVFTVNNFQKHMKNVHSSSCRLCPCNFIAPNDSVLELHRIVVHRWFTSDTKEFPCPMCPNYSVTFKTVKNLIAHADQRHYFFIRGHNNPS